MLPEHPKFSSWSLCWTGQGPRSVSRAAQKQVQSAMLDINLWKRAIQVPGTPMRSCKSASKGAFWTLKSRLSSNILSKIDVLWISTVFATHFLRLLEGWGIPKCAKRRLWGQLVLYPLSTTFLKQCRVDIHLKTNANSKWKDANVDTCSQKRIGRNHCKIHMKSTIFIYHTEQPGVHCLDKKRYFGIWIGIG